MRMREEALTCHGRVVPVLLGSCLAGWEEAALHRGLAEHGSVPGASSGLATPTAGSPRRASPGCPRPCGRSRLGTTTWAS